MGDLEAGPEEEGAPGNETAEENSEDSEAEAEEKPPRRPIIKLGDVMGVKFQSFSPLLFSSSFCDRSNGCSALAKSSLIGVFRWVLSWQILNKRAIEASEKERPVPDIRTGDIVEIKLVKLSSCTLTSTIISSLLLASVMRQH